MTNKLQAVENIKKKINDLDIQQNALKKDLQKALAEAKYEAIEEIANYCFQYSIDPNELPKLLEKPLIRLQKEVNRKEGTPRKAKYQDPISGSTWSGVGKTPKWLQGKNLDDYLIKNIE